MLVTEKHSMLLKLHDLDSFFGRKNNTQELNAAESTAEADEYNNCLLRTRCFACYASHASSPHPSTMLLPAFLLCMYIHTVNINKIKLYLHDIVLYWCQEPVKQLYSAPEM